MHGEHETSNSSRIVCTLCHLVFLGAAYWIYFGGGAVFISEWLTGETTLAGNPGRRMALFSFSIILFLRMNLALFYLLKRKFGWDELVGVLFALFVYQVLFSLLGVRENRPIGALDIFAIALFLTGNYFNAGSEWQRKRFKDRPENRGMLYTQGLFRYARHINYFGDTLWVTAWALLTRNIWSVIIPVSLTAAFVFGFIPSLTKYLSTSYGEQFDAWAERTKAFVPFLY